MSLQHRDHAPDLAGFSLRGLAAGLLFLRLMRLPWRIAASCLVAVVGCSSTHSDSITVPFDPDPPEVYVAKVKNILVGLPPTDAEVAAVKADPTALPGLIDTWMATPQYQQKMMVFFELAFQQTQITATDFVDISPPNGLGNGTQVPLVVQNSEESFARTMLANNSAGAPLSSSFTTKTVMLTPALAMLYAYLDTHQADDTSKVTDLFQKANPKLTITLEASGGPIPIAESLDSSGSNYMHFYNPTITTQNYPAGDEACDGVDPISFNANSQNLWDVMYGEIPPHTVGTGSDAVQCPIRGGGITGSQFAATDFTTWNMVTIRQPQAGEATTNFYDLPTLRSTSELVLDAPRPGFFTTPAFQTNWPTNTSNQMRVTLNQALIVATGTAVDGTDATTPGSTPGLDSEHAVPGSACYGCHQLLDPTRSILTKTYTFFYNSPQTDPLYDTQPGLFAFQGVVQQMQTIDDFANILASHPLVPQAWAEKLCYYANSAPCDPNDPVFQQIVADFANGFSWNTLVRELLSSPITTNASHTTTYDTNGEVIAVTRRDHLCAALNNRLGLTDICQLDAADQTGKLSTIAQIVSGMPSDGYGRGAPIPVLPNQPTLFYRGGLENICASISSMVIDAKPTTQQPNVKIWSSSQPTAAIADFVSQIMSLTSADPRAAQANALLTAHFQAAQQAGATATDSLRSTFVAACLSPTFIGIGM
jgi:hypothetical protein